MIHAALSAIATIAVQPAPPVIRPLSAPRPVRKLVPPRTRIVRLPTLRDRKLAECKAAGGRWYISIKGVDMTAYGSDVDELYGTIWIAASNRAGEVRRYENTRREPYRTLPDLWFSPENQNVGKYGAKNLSTVTVTMDGTISGPSGPSNMNDYVLIHFGVKDEDDGRGGSNDELFTVQFRSSPYNAYLLKTPMPSCDEAPEYQRETRFKLRANSNGNNSLYLRLHAKWYRQFPHIK